ncbi:hypothetical protein [Aliidiomarina sanyensis]|uniref:Uncharacterized protein n=1 Tax=Aliidiomarina sanyensis TaxID=1249555 RepID=A0A432WBN6_9GAMM|nr:hypothetical protein [Aliidiomarina sanyensis]RUO29487.1 hypothetical protein CWE11_09575 [Aliidiomarina sanyensis]
MKNDDLDELSALWQEQAPKAQLNLTDLQRKYRKHRWLMRFNLVIEPMLLVIVTSLAVWGLLSGETLHKTLWIAVLVIWGWVLFVPLTVSRWRSFRLMKSKSLRESVDDHIHLLDQEILRWRLSFYATGTLLVVLLALTVWTFISELHAYPLWVEMIVFAGLILLMAFFRKRRQACEVLRESFMQ